MRKFLSQLWQDEAGFVISTELIFVATIAVIGLLTGLTTVRDQVASELADVADAVSEMDQSYTLSAVTAHTSSTAGHSFADQSDFCEAAGADDQGTNTPQCLDVNVAPAGGETT